MGNGNGFVGLGQQWHHAIKGNFAGSCSAPVASVGIFCNNGVADCGPGGVCTLLNNLGPAGGNANAQLLSTGGAAIADQNPALGTATFYVANVAAPGTLNGALGCALPARCSNAPATACSSDAGCGGAKCLTVKPGACVAPAANIGAACVCDSQCIGGGPGSCVGGANGFQLECNQSLETFGCPTGAGLPYKVPSNAWGPAAMADKP